MPEPRSTEGFLDFTLGGDDGTKETFKTWYRVVGDLNAGPPLITLHGGPGAAHHYLTCLEDLCISEDKVVRAVILYDQLGCGSSTHLKEKPSSFWSPELFMSELDNLIVGLGIGSFDLIGHSWGGMLASQYAATRQPAGLRRLIISDSPASMPLWEEAAGSLISGMPGDVQKTLRKHEAAGTTDSEEYQTAMGVFYAKHLCRINPMPELVSKSFECLTDDPTVYHTMNGPSEFFVTGSLKQWTVVPELHRIQVPTLVLNGRYDEAQDICVKPFFQLIPKVKWYTFAESSHMPHWEERERYKQIVGDFLSY